MFIFTNFFETITNTWWVYGTNFIFVELKKQTFRTVSLHKKVLHDAYLNRLIEFKASSFKLCQCFRFFLVIKLNNDSETGKYVCSERLPHSFLKSGQIINFFHTCKSFVALAQMAMVSNIKLDDLLSGGQHTVARGLCVRKQLSGPSRCPDTS